MNDNSRCAQFLVLAAAFLGWMFDGLEMGVFPLVARPALRDMMGHVAAGVSPDKFVGQWMGYITALFLLGAAAGGVVFGWLGDRIGRVRAMSLTILGYSAFTGMCYFAKEPWHLGLFRFLAAFGMGGEWSLGVALVMEAWPRDKRPLLAGIIGAASNVGFALIAVFGRWLEIKQSNWRLVMIAGAAPALLALLVVWFVPESERWKESVRNEGKGSPLKEIFSGSMFVKTLLAIAFAAIALIGTWGSVQWLPVWAGQLTDGLPSHGQAGATTQILSGVGAIVGCLIGALFAGKFGRRPAYFGLCVLSVVLCQILFRGVNEYGNAFLFLVFCIGGVTAAFYGWLPLYLPELFPTRVRATGQGVSFNSGRVLAAVGALTQGQLVAHYSGSYAKAGAVITLIYLLGLALIWLAPETKDRPLPE